MNRKVSDWVDLVPPEISSFLLTSTPASWLNHACDNLPVLLIDHANCEKKAASTAISLMFRYSEEAEICYRMSRLAREELRHYEQVLKLINAREIQLKLFKPSRYASTLMAHVSKEEPNRLPELLIVGGIIEARSCERFAALIPYLEKNNEFTLAKFYSGLLASEARHFKHYLDLAKQYSSDVFTDVEYNERVTFFLTKESELILQPDKNFHFHSGMPV